MFRPPAQVVAWLPVCASVLTAPLIDFLRFTATTRFHHTCLYIIICSLHTNIKSESLCSASNEAKSKIHLHLTYRAAFHRSAKCTNMFPRHIWTADLEANMSAPAAPLRFVANRMKFSWSKELDSRLLNYLACDCPLPKEFSQSDSRLFWCQQGILRSCSFPKRKFS